MINQPRIPDKETIDRHVAKMQEICQRWDVLIAGLDELNAKLDADFQNSPLGALYKRRMERLASQQKQNSHI